MQDQDNSQIPTPQPEPQPGAQPAPQADMQPQSITDKPTPVAKSKKKPLFFIIGGIVAVVIIIVIACIAINSPNTNKTIFGPAPSEKPQLQDDEILIGFYDKYFFTAKTYGEVAKKVVELYGDTYLENDQYKFEKNNNLDELLNNKPGSYKAMIVPSRSDIARKNNLVMPVFTLGYYRLGNSDDYKDKDTVVGERKFDIDISCIDGGTGFIFEIDDMEFECGKTTKAEVDNMLKESGHLIPKKGFYGNNYKNYEIKFDYFLNNDKIQSVRIISVDDKYIQK
jgi:hypothetical protein